ncbi:MAG: hypothetical protein WCK83_13410 [Burkholderiales bacterium]
MRTNHFRLSVLALGLASALSANAQSADGDRLKALEQKFGQSLAVIEQLQKRIVELEQGKSGAAAVAAPAAVISRVETLEKSVSDLAVSASKGVTDTGLPLHGFLDVGYATANGTPAAYDKSGFRLGTFDIYLTPQFSDRVKGLVELAFEYGSDGGLGTDLERMQLGYVVNDNLTLWGGRFHTPYGYWNTAFHHGAQIQTSITRPRMIAFEDQGGILPSHSVGAWATGKMDSGMGRVNYDVFVGNSDSMRDGTLDYNASGFENGTASMGFNLGISPKAMPGLTMGVHGVTEKINIYSAADADAQSTLQMAGAYAFYESDNWEIIAEYYDFNNKDNTGNTGTHHSSAGFIQAGLQVANRTTAFARYEKADLNQNDPYFKRMSNETSNFGSSYHQSTVGLRYDLDPRSALKLQLEQITDEGNANQTVNWLRAQYSVRF